MTPKVNIEINNDHLWLILPDKSSELVMHYQDAWALGNALIKAAKEIPTKAIILNMQELADAQVFMRDNKYVALVLKFVDRIKVSSNIAEVMGRTLIITAQKIKHATEQKVKIIV